MNLTVEGSTTITVNPADMRQKPPSYVEGMAGVLSGAQKDYWDNRFVFTMICARARGLAIGVNLCPDKLCNFDCIYCDVHRNGDPQEDLNVDTMASEVKRTLATIRSGNLRERPWYHAIPDELLHLRHVALCGDGEPTLAPKFEEALQAIVHVRAVGGEPFFKLVLYTNGTVFDMANVRQGLKHLTLSDEVWVKLDAGTQAYMNRVNRPSVSMDKVLSNILDLGRIRPIVIQSLFPAIDGEEPPLEEVEQYAQRLLELKRAGACISCVQIYSATRPSPNSQSSHLPLKVLSNIAHTVRQSTGLLAEVY